MVFNFLNKFLEHFLVVPQKNYWTCQEMENDHEPIEKPAHVAEPFEKIVSRSLVQYLSLVQLEVEGVYFVSGWVLSCRPLVSARQSG